jgi:hypothetical protein
MAIADKASGEIIMKSMKGAIVLATIIATVAVAACRREEYHEPLKLGASDVPVASNVAR